MINTRFLSRGQCCKAIFTFAQERSPAQQNIKSYFSKVCYLANMTEAELSSLYVSIVNNIKLMLCCRKLVNCGQL